MQQVSSLPYNLSAYPKWPSEEEKKILAPLLGKVYVSPASSEDKLRDLYAEVSTAVDDKLLSDATGRNALFKIHVSLGKIVNALGTGEKQGRKQSKAVDTTMPSPVESPAAEKTSAAEEEEDGDDNTVVDAARKTPKARGGRRKGGSIGVDELQDEDEAEDDGTVIDDGRTIMTKRGGGGRDSLMSELLSDEESDEF